MNLNNTVSHIKIILFILLSLTILTVFRVAWESYYTPPKNYQAVNGAVNLNNANLQGDTIMRVNGEWGFTPGKFLDPINPSPAGSLIEVPGDWSDELSADHQVDTYGYGTYQVNVTLPDTDFSSYGIRFERISTAAKVFVNGELVKESEPVATNTETSSARMHGPFSGYFSTQERELNIVVHLSNFEIPLFGGITKSVEIGSYEAIHNKATQSIILQIIITFIYLLHAAYVFFIYFLRKSNLEKELLFYGLLTLHSAIVLLFDQEVLLTLPFEADKTYKLVIFFYITTLFLIGKFIQHVIKSMRKAYDYMTYYYVGLVIINLLLPLDYFYRFAIFVLGFFVITVPFLFYDVIQKIRHGYRDGFFILLALTGYTSNMLWGSGIKLAGFEFPYYPFDTLITILVLAFMLLKKQIYISNQYSVQTEKLKEADKQKDEFLARTSHELRNPLHGIINIGQSLLEQSSSKKSHENITLLLQIGRQMKHTLNDLLAISQLKDGRIKLKQEAIHLRSVAAGILEMAKFMPNKENVVLKLDVPASFPPIRADENRLTQVMFNLVYNAVRYTNEGSISISAKQEKGMAVISVEDTGVGIKQEDQQRLFQPYEQVDSSINTADGGIGLGLSICQELVKLHGGDIYLQSTVGVGTTVTFSIPLAAKQEETSEIEVAPALETVPEPLHQESPQQLPIDAATILLVDDDPVNLKVLENILQADYKIMKMVDPMKALEIIEQHQIDLLIADVMMPTMSGYELTREVRKKHTLTELPILLLTARHQPEDLQAGLAVGANDYVTKPVDAIELRARLHALISLKLSVSEQLRTEAAWLQSQIQPHFLFNTLNTIVALQDIDQKRANRLLEKFGNYLRGSFKEYYHKRLIPLAEELDLVRSYLYIEKERFGDRILVNWDVEQNELYLPPFTIQPLIENALRHGILKRSSGGTIGIQVKKSGIYYKVCITDNGVGMSQVKIEEILQLTRQTGGVGVTNTHRRLLQLYGEGLTIQSEPDKGTKISFRLPSENTVL
ncbi:hybrid sensor histidine kinase/response regulator [Oceanobacillus kapialis]|uniref:histidine kinase n=1 Tax=Oceanobacillus kapialis TaxID=481353 RepID=A0ABW5Q2T6_9BACI